MRKLLVSLFLLVFFFSHITVYVFEIFSDLIVKGKKPVITIYKGVDINMDHTEKAPARIILCMHPTNERRRYIVTPSLIGWAHTQKYPYTSDKNT